MAPPEAGLDLSDAVDHHHGAFPPSKLDLDQLIAPLVSATALLGRYDEMLRTMLNGEVLLGPLRRRDAVVSSRMEGTVSTIDEVLELEADEAIGDPDARRTARSETVEVFLCSRALKNAQDRLAEGAPLADWLVREAHQTLLSYGRGAGKRPGTYKTEQNYIVERTRPRKVLFKPISPESLQSGMDRLFGLVNGAEPVPILRAALAHAEFEALHPFLDGNGRVGRMLITLMLWHHGIISQPHFFVSGYFEENKPEYLERMRRVSSHGQWSEWCGFFLTALGAQAQENIRVAEAIHSLCARMRDRFHQELSSRWSVHVLDFMFANPIFRNSRFASASGIPAPTTYGLVARLLSAGLLREIQPSSGRRAALYAFEPLLEVVREPR